MELENRKLVLFFTCGISLDIWHKAGNLTREIKLYNILARHFEKIHFITYGKKEELKFKEKLAKNIEILPKKICLPSKIYQFFIPLIYRKELKEIDIYKTNQMGASVPAILSKWFYKKKLVVRCGYEWLEFLEKQKVSHWGKKAIYFIEKIAYKNADKIVLTSEKDKKFVLKKFKIYPPKIEIIPNYIAVNLFKPLNNSKEKNRIIFVGRLEEEKNLFNLIEGIANLPVKLVVIGSGPLREKLEKFSKEKNANVEFKRNIDNEKLPEELNKSGIFILTSFYEGCPKTLLEAMACGLPCIGANIEGIREIVNHKKNGYLCEKDVESIMKAILRVLEDKTLREKISKNARRTILENFSLDKILEKELKIYEAIAAHIPFNLEKHGQ